ncbi:hypothetical protein SRHO_G00029570 [Serrasalmus rhombeus]
MRLDQDHSRPAEAEPVYTALGVCTVPCAQARAPCTIYRVSSSLPSGIRISTPSRLYRGVAPVLCSVMDERGSRSQHSHHCVQPALRLPPPPQNTQRCRPTQTPHTAPNAPLLSCEMFPRSGPDRHGQPHCSSRDGRHDEAIKQGRAKTGRERLCGSFFLTHKDRLSDTDVYGLRGRKALLIYCSQVRELFILRSL